jgi:HEAT repeat protein
VHPVQASPAERLAALEALPEGPGREAAILAALEDESIAVREMAIRLAARYVEPPILGELVADEVNAVRRNGAIAALERQGPYAVPHLRSMLASPAVDVVMFALQMLSRIGDASAVPSVVPLARHRDPNIAQSAVEALGRLRSSAAVPTLLHLLDGGLWLQVAAIEALGEIGNPVAVEPLIALIPDSIVAEPAVKALQRIAAPESLELLIQRFPGVRERSLRDALLLAIGVVIDLHPDPEQLVVGSSAEVELDSSRDVLSYLGEILQRGLGGTSAATTAGAEGRDAEGLLRAAIALIVVGRLRSVYVPALILIATQDSAAWAAGLFRRYPDALSPVLEQLLRHSDLRVQRGALLAGTFEDGHLVRVLEHLKSPDVRVRAAACQALGRIGRPEGVPLLIHRLREGEPLERAAAVDALAAFPGESLEALESCLAADAAEPVMAGALEVLARRGHGLFESRIGELARHPSPVVRLAALRALAAIPGARAEVLLIRALADRHQPIQVAALELLGKREHGRTIPTLSALLGTTDSIRYHVIRALGYMGAIDAASRLESMYEQCSPHEQAEIVLALTRIGAPGLREFLHLRLAEQEPEMRRIAARGLATLADPTQLSLLITLAADSDWCIRDEAARGLGLLVMPECRQTLLTLVRDIEPVVAATAREALTRVQAGASAAA